MPLLYGAHFRQDNASDAKPHIFAFGTARTTPHDTLFELWNGTSSAAIKAAVDLDGKFYSNALTAGDMLYAVTGGVANVRRLDSLAIGSANEVMVTDGSIPVWSDTITDVTLVDPTVNGLLTIQMPTGKLYITPVAVGEDDGIFEIGGQNHYDGIGQVLKGVYWHTQFDNDDGYASVDAVAVWISPAYGDTQETETFGDCTDLVLRSTSRGTVTITDWRGLHIIPIAGGYDTTTNYYAIYIEDITGATNNYAIYSEGGTVTILGDGIVVGAATGGDKGVGTINVSVDIYQNNVVYTDPDAVLEKHFTGEVKLHRNSPFSDYPGLMVLADVEAYARAEFQLPRVGWARGVFERTDVLLEKVEETFLYLFDHERRIAELEKLAA